jgi:hypothetical protein
VVAAESISDLPTVVTERAPFFFSPDTIRSAIKLAEQNATFQMNAVSPAVAARSITAAVLLIHGAADVNTPPDHSQRVFAALTGPKRLILVPGARHNESLQGSIWEEIERWIDTVLPPAPDIAAPPSTSPAPGPKNEKTSADALILALTAEDFNVREQAEQSLAALGESALPALQRNAHSADPEVRMRVNRLLGLAGSGRLKRMFAAKQKFSGFAAAPSRHWPCIVKVKQYDAKTGRFEAQLEWKTLGSLVVIEGTLTDQRLVFTETRFIRNGNSMLNCVYTFNLKDADNQSATKIHGTWIDPTGERGGKVELSASED